MLTRSIRFSWCLSIGAVLLLTQPVFLSATDRDALISLYNSTSGDSWVNNPGWKDAPTLADGFNDDPCAVPLWYGVTCTGDSVTQLGLPGNDLMGPIPPELGNLSNLENFSVNDNYLTGTIPTWLAKLPQLRQIGLDENLLTGPILVELSNLSNLNCLNLSRNKLTGIIPPELGNLSNLKYLYFYENNVTGPIPSEFGNLSKLQNFWADVNQLTGSIPPGLVNLPNLAWLRLNDNQLTGPIPSICPGCPEAAGDFSGTGQSFQAAVEQGNPSKLQRLQLSFNQLTGLISPELGNLSLLTDLELEGNQLTGLIPSELTNLSRLTKLELSGNQLYTDNNTLRAFITTRNNSEKFLLNWESEQTLNTYFAQFADGDGLSSQIILFNLNDQVASTGQIEIRDDSGDLLSVDLNGEIVSGQAEISVPAAGLLTLRTDGLGDIETGSVRVMTGRHVEGVVIFGGSMGLAGVGSSPQFPTGFVARCKRATL